MSPQEFENIVPALRPLMVKVGRDFFGNESDADDVAQEGLIRLWNYCERLDARRNMEALAVRVAKNVCVEIYRKRNNNTFRLLFDRGDGTIVTELWKRSGLPERYQQAFGTNVPVYQVPANPLPNYFGN